MSRSRSAGGNARSRPLCRRVGRCGDEGPGVPETEHPHGVVRRHDAESRSEHAHVVKVEGLLVGEEGVKLEMTLRQRQLRQKQPHAPLPAPRQGRPGLGARVHREDLNAVLAIDPDANVERQPGIHALERHVDGERLPRAELGPGIARAVVYDDFQHAICFFVFTQLTLQPGQTEAYSLQWLQRNASGQQVPPSATYRIRGYLDSFEPAPDAFRFIRIGP